jgi:hypothetical protein
MTSAADDTRQRLGKIYALEIIAVAIAALGDLDARTMIESEFAGRAPMLAAVHAIWEARWDPALLAGLTPQETVIAARAWDILVDPESTTALLPAPFAQWLAAGPVPDGDVQASALERLPERTQRVVLAALAYFEAQWERRERERDRTVEPLVNAIVAVAHARAAGDDGSSFLEPGVTLDAYQRGFAEAITPDNLPGRAALHRLWAGDRDEETLLAQAGTPHLRYLIQLALRQLSQ